MHKHNDDTIIKTSDTVLSKKYTSHFIWKGCVWEGVGDRTELQHIDSHSIGHNRVSFRSPGLLNQGPGGQASLGHVPQSSILSLTRLIPNCNCSIGGLGPSLSGCWLSLPHLDSNCWISCARSYIIVQYLPSSCGRHKLHSFNPSTVKVILCYSSTGCTCYLHRWISYFDSPAGS